MMLLAAVLTLTLSAPEGWQAKEPRIVVEITEERIAATSETVIPDQLVSIAKYAEPHDGFNPTFQVMLTRPQDMTAEEMLAVIVKSLSSLSPDYKVEEQIRATKIAGRDAATMTSTNVALRGDRRIPTRVRTFAVPFERFVLIIGVSAPQTEDVRAPIDAVLQSVKVE